MVYRFIYIFVLFLLFSIHEVDSYCYKGATLRPSRPTASVGSAGYPGWDNEWKSCWFQVLAPPNNVVRMTCNIAIPYCSIAYIDVYRFGDLNTRRRICGGNDLRYYDITSRGNLLYFQVYGRSMKYACTFTYTSEFPVSSTTRAARTTTAVTTPTSDATLTCGVTTSTTQTRIFGGTKVNSAEIYPWQVRLVNKTGGTFCGGALVSDLWVVSAAHCMVFPYGEQQMHVILGDIHSNSSGGGITRSVAKWMRHNGYSRHTVRDDIAVIQLSSPVTFSNRIRPICLPCNYMHTDFTGDYITLAGWGENEKGVMQNQLMEVSVPVVSNDVCKNKYGYFVRDTNLCAGEPEGGKDSCSGDSGGPAVWSESGVNYLLGVVSFGKRGGCGKAGWPGVYTRVTKYINWIEDSTGVEFCQ